MNNSSSNNTANGINALSPVDSPFSGSVTTVVNEEDIATTTTTTTRNNIAEDHQGTATTNNNESSKKTLAITAYVPFPFFLYVTPINLMSICYIVVSYARQEKLNVTALSLPAVGALVMAVSVSTRGDRSLDSARDLSASWR